MDSHALSSYVSGERGSLYPPASFSTFMERPGLNPVRVEMRLGDRALAVVVEIDGKCYGGVADLTQVWDVAKKYLAAYHRELHMRGHALIGAAPSPEVIADIIATDAIQRIGTELVATCCAGWFGDLERSIKKEAKDLEKDVAHYALHPSDIVVDTAKALGAGKGLAKALSYAVDPLQDITENPMVEKAMASYAGGPAGAAALQAAQSAEQGKLSLSQLASAAQAAAPMLQQFGADPGLVSSISNAASQVKQVAQNPMQYAQNLAQPYVQQAQQLAQPYVQQAQGLAQQAQGYAQGLSQQAQGLAQQVSQQAQGLAQQAQGAVTDATQQVQQTISDMGSQAPADLSAAQAAISGGASPRELAMEGAKGMPHRVVGVVQMSDGQWQLRGFQSSDDADDWFGGWLGVPNAYVYVAYYDKADPTFPNPLNEQFSPHAQTHVSGWLGGLALLTAGVAAGVYGPSAYRYARGRWADHEAKAGK
jgi:hypothetical protein